MKTKLILVRHGETETNVAGKLHKDKDPKTLNNIGKEQINKTAKQLLEYKPTKIFSSKEKRALESAGIISKTCNIPVQPIDDLQERDWGDFSGKTWPEISKVLEKLTLDERFNYVPPNGESWKQFDTRLKTRIDNILQTNKGGVVVVVSHGGAIRALMPYLLDVPKEESFKYDPANASITMFEYSNDKFKKMLIDDTSHL